MCIRDRLRAALPNADGRLLATAEQRQAVLPIVLEQQDAAALIRRATAAGDTARSSAIAALGRLGGDAAKTALERILANKGEDGAIRALAFRSLRRVERRVTR